MCFVRCMSQEQFSPDSTVNGILILTNRESVQDFYKDISKIHLQDEISSYNPFGYTFVAYLNKDSTQYLIAFKFDGDVCNSYSVFEIGNVADDFFKNISDYIVTDYQSFHTESGIGPNMPINQLFKIKGDNYCVMKDNSIIYYLDESNSEFLTKHKMPEYLLKVDADNGIVSKINFGFTYP